MRSTAGLVLAVVVALAGCSGAPDPAWKTPTTQEETVLLLFELAKIDEPAAEAIDGLFGTIEDESARAGLLDAIEALHVVEEISIVATYPMDDLARASFDLVGQLPGGGIARYSAQLNTATKPNTIVWFSGPGVEWPERRLRGPGLSTSAPPTPAGGG